MMAAWSSRNRNVQARRAPIMRAAAMTLPGDSLPQHEASWYDASKRSPALVVQANAYNAQLGHVIVAEITKNLTPANDPAFVLIDISSSEGKATGLDQNSLVSGLFLATVFEDRIDRVIGNLTGALM